ncbi:MAG: response regulator [Denitromonas halophila]|nr:MAG: response regulator [Denitromonas halophila]TVT74550.1 MAG: response regulator [Denitromonas halophila]
MALKPHRSLGRKLRSIVLVSIIVALVVAFLAIGLSELRQEVQRIQDQADIYAELVVENGAAPLRFEDAGSAERLLGSLRHVEQIRAALLRRANGEVFATYPIDLEDIAPNFYPLQTLRVDEAGIWEFPRYFRAWPVRHDGEYLGDLVLEVSLAGMLADMVEWFVLALVGLGLGGLVATLLVRRAEQSIVQPVVQLASVVRDVRNSGRYDVRAPAGPRDEVGELVDGFNSMLTEIEARDSALAAHRDRLEQDVALRTGELSMAKEEADAAREEAEAANRAKSLFLANMSHEIRTPMNGVLGMVELLRGTEMNSRQVRLIDTLHASAESLLYLINDVLDVSKIEAGKLELEQIEFSPRQAVEDVALLFAERAQRKDVELMVVVSANVPERVCADGHRFRQVLNNLVSNAVKFTDKGYIRIDLDARIAADGQLRLAGSVTDTGIGIPAELQPRLFQAFSQADSSMARRFGGTGLGLTISRQLVELMGGRLEFESIPEERTRFFFAVDARLCDPAPVFKPAGRVAIVAGGAPLRDALMVQTEALGYEADGYADPEALARAGAAPYVAVLVDRHGTNSDGFARIAQMTRSGQRIVAMVRLRSASDEEDARAAGAEACVPKPVLASDLLAVLRGDASRQVRQQVSSAPSLRSRARVLLAEDHPVNAEIVCALLGECGCRVTVANNGREAVAMYRKGAFDLVLMDIQMPDMDGIEATREIRRAERSGTGSERVPILALTANAQRDDRAAALSAGMDDYLTKPVSGERLREALMRWAPTAPVDAPAVLGASAAEPADSTIVGELPALDMAVLLGVPGVRGDRAAPMLKRLATLFVRETGQQVQALAEAFAQQDRPAAQRVAHKMKSAAAAVGASRLAGLARSLDTALKAGEDMSELPEVAELQPAFVAYQKALVDEGVELDGATAGKDLSS